MGIFLTDLADEEHDLSCNWWNWRPTLELIERHLTVAPDQLDRMTFSGGGGRLTEAQARQLAVILRTEIIPAIPEGGRVLHDGTTTDVPDDGTLHRDEPEKNYSASRAWLEKLAAFCERCAGFEVI